MDVGSSNTIKVVNESLQNAELILLNANPTFLDNNASFSLNTGTNSNFVTNPSPLNLQVSAPLVATSQPSLCAAPTNQVMTVMLPGTIGPVQQAAAHSGIPLYPPCEQAAPHLLATNGSSQVRDLVEEILCSRMSVSLPRPLVTGSRLGPPRPFLTPKRYVRLT